MSVSVLLAAGFVLLQAVQPQHAALAATSAQPTSVWQGAIGHQPRTAQEWASFGQEKRQLANEQMAVLQRMETSAVYERHMLTFMTKWNLGNTANLHTVLTNGPRKTGSAAGLPSKVSPKCISIAAAAGITPNFVCKPPPQGVGAAQFPEVYSNYCGPATVATIAVEDSFTWPGANDYSYSGHDYFLQYDQSVVSQNVSTIATSDEYNTGFLTGVNPPGAGGQQSANKYNMVAAMNDYVKGKGGLYAVQDGSYGFQSSLISDANTGWDVAVGVEVVDYSWLPNLPGWPHNSDGHVRAHWLAATYYHTQTTTGDITEYADPVFNAPAYPGWGMGAHWNMPTATLMALIPSKFGYVW